MQNLKTFEKALREIYLPLWQNQLGIEPSPFLARIKKEPLLGNEIVAAAPIGLSGGFGFGEEGLSTPQSGNVILERFKTSAKDMYVNICISAKAVRLGTTAGAMADALQTEVKAAYDAAKWNVGRAIFGNGTGILAKSTESATSDVIKVDDTKNLKEGLIIDVISNPGETGEVVATARIKAIDRASKTVALDASVTVTTDSVFTVQNSFRREITGLGAIFDEKVTSIYGVRKSANPYLTPVVEDANSSIDDSVITRALRRADRDKNSKVDMLLAGDAAYDAYIDYLRANNIRVEESSHEVTGGFKAIKFIFGNRVVDIVNESFVPDNEIYGVDTNAFRLHTQDWNFCDLQGGGIFNLMEGQSVYRALLANYGDLLCQNPGGCVRITNCSE